MGLSLSAFQGNSTGSSPCSVTIAIPSGSAVGVLVYMSAGFGLGYNAGTISDTASNIYTSAGGGNYAGSLPTEYTDSLYCLNAASATSLTYTANAAITGIGTVYVLAWAWTVAGGSATFGSQSNNEQSSPGTGSDAVTSGSVTCSTGSVIMGLAHDSTENFDLTVGTGFTQDYIGTFSAVYGQHGAFNSSQGSTWTCSVGTNPILSQAISFGFYAVPLLIVPGYSAASGLGPG